uniref:Alpha-galactosidase NEW3 domain-containing protein n=1 Tax=Thermofilum adornatum TaxID=1365176 RepID=A0A7C1GLI1_9CREN
MDKAQLSLGVMGTYKLSFVTQSFYMEMVPGSTQTFQIQVQNTGYSSLTNLNLAFTSVPKGFTVNIDPVNVLVLKPGDTATFTVTITTTGDINTGDYYLTFVVKADQLPQTSRDLHVYVKPQQSMVYVALAAVLLVVGALYLVYRRFGRR